MTQVKRKAGGFVPAISLRDRITGAIPYILLTGYSIVALFPMFLIVINSFKDRRELFRTPYQPPLWFNFDDGFQIVNTFSAEGYERVFEQSQVFGYFANSIFITSVSLFFVLLLGTTVAYALNEYDFRGNRLLYVFMVIGVMIPLRLGTVSLIKLITSLGIYDTHLALILVYIAKGLPVGLFILSEFMRQVPRELKDAARVDGANEYWILFQLIIPLIRPALATVLVFQLIPIWNDLWFPLTLAPSEGVRTVTLGVSSFAGQYKQDWSALLAALTLAMIPVTGLYIVFSRQFIRGLTRGALK